MYSDSQELKCYKDILYPTSFISFFTFLFAIYLKLYFLAIVPLLVGLTSIIHWYNPKDDIYRKCDILIVFISTIYFSIISIKYNIKIYFLIIFFSVIFYLLSFYFINKKDYKKSAFVHSLIHIFGNIGNIFFFIIIYNILINN